MSWVTSRQALPAGQPPPLPYSSAKEQAHLFPPYLPWHSQTNSSLLLSYSSPKASSRICQASTATLPTSHPRTSPRCFRLISQKNGFGGGRLYPLAPSEKRDSPKHHCLPPPTPGTTLPPAISARSHPRTQPKASSNSPGLPPPFLSGRGTSSA